MDYLCLVIAATLLRGLRQPHHGTFGDEAANLVLEGLRAAARSMKIEWDEEVSDNGDRNIRLHSLECSGLNPSFEAYAWREEMAIISYCHEEKEVKVWWDYLNFDSELGWGEEVPQMHHLDPLEERIAPRVMKYSWMRFLDESAE